MSEIDYTIMPLFSTPLYIKNFVPLSNDEEIILKSSKLERMQSDNGYFSQDKYILDSTKELKRSIESCINEYVFDELKVSGPVKFYFTNSWIVKHKKNDWAHQHAHTNCILSGVYYFDVDENSGVLSFHKESNHFTVFPMHLDLDVSEHNIINSKAWSFTPKNHQLFIFPPWLKHGVSGNNSDKDRYSLAFNVYLKGKIGKKEYELEIK